MLMFMKRYRIWLFYSHFVVIASIFGGREPLITTQSTYVFRKYLILILSMGFVAFSI